MRGLGRMMRSAPRHGAGGGFRHSGVSGGGSRRGNMGLVMLAIEIFRVGWDRIPPVTLSLLGSMIFVFLNPVDFHMHTLGQACLSATRLLHDPAQNAYRVATHAFYHANDFHLYYNMVSLIHKGMQLEPRLGLQLYVGVLGAIVVLESLIYVFVVETLMMIFGRHAPMVGSDCCVGFSGVLFGMKVVLQATNPNPNTVSSFFGLFTVSNKYAHWFELLLVSIIMPQASLLGHLSGILAGTVISHMLLQWSGHGNYDTAVTTHSPIPDAEYDNAELFACPMFGCTCDFYTADELQTHVNSQHFADDTADDVHRDNGESSGTSSTLENPWTQLDELRRGRSQLREEPPPESVQPTESSRSATQNHGGENIAKDEVTTGRSGSTSASLEPTYSEDISDTTVPEPRQLTQQELRARRVARFDKT